MYVYIIKLRCATILTKIVSKPKKKKNKERRITQSLCHWPAYMCMCVTKVICEHDLDGYWEVPAALQKIYQLVNNITNCNVIN